MSEAKPSKPGPLIWFVTIPERLTGPEERALTLGLGPEDTHPNRLPETLHPRVRAERLLGRYYLRQLLEAATDHPATTWRISPDGDGKPQVTHPQASSTLHINVSHTRGALLCGLSHTAPLGVDLEDTHRKVEFEKLQQRCFTPAEIAWIGEASDQRDGFFRAWTLKEAYLKATGMGIRIELKDLEIIPKAEGTIGIYFRDKPETGWTIETRRHHHFRLAWCEAQRPNIQSQATCEFMQFVK